MQLLQVHIGRLLNITMPQVVIVTASQQKIKEEPAPELVQDGAQEDSDAYSVAVFPAKRLVKEKSRKLTTPKSTCSLNSAYTFDSFIVGSNSSLAYAAAHAVAEHPGVVYNPLFIYGCSGLGKTHLLHAIGNAIKAQNKRQIILYLTSDRFVNEFINAIRFDKIHLFREKYKHIDVLLIDDVQFLSNKEQTQEAFFHIFNYMYDAHKQIIFSSDTLPYEIKGLAERLQSRLSWGLVADIHTPSLETKVAILKKKADAQGEILCDEVAHFIASHVVSNIRELEGALIRVMAFSLLTKQPVSIELARKVIMKSGVSKERTANFAHVVRSVNKHYPYSLDELRSKSRNKDLAFARHLLMFLMKKATGKSLRDIGSFLGGRDHSTVLSGITKMEDFIDEHPEFREKLRRIESDIL